MYEIEDKGASIRRQWQYEPLEMLPIGVFVIVVVAVFVLKLIQNAASGSLSLASVFSFENIIETSIIAVVVGAVVAVGAFFKQRRDRSQS